MATPEQLADSERLWVTVPEVMRFERISRREVYNRLRPGDARFLVSRNRIKNGIKPGELINALSMTYEAQQRWRAEALAAIAAPKPAAAASAQGSLFERTEAEGKIEALSVSRSERDVIMRRYSVGAQCLNHDWKAQNFENKRAFQSFLAQQHNTSLRNIQRWAQAAKREDYAALRKNRPGPEPCSALSDDAKAHLRGCWVFEKLTVKQCYRSLLRYLEAKQNSPGCRVDHLYEIPSYRTAARFVRSLDSLDQAARKGQEALKAACGYIDRTYRDLKSLERVETDEWKCDFFSYFSERRAKAARFYLLTFYDERSLYPLCWKLVEGDKFDKRHGVKEEDEVDLLVRLLKEYGVPGALVSDRGRFRGGTFGGNDRFKNADGILDRLGIAHPLPREKNPQSNRLERFHRFLADQCRTIQGWIGANTGERESTPGDAEKLLHERWAAGDPEVPRTPLLSTEEALLRINEWMEQWRAHESEGTDMDGLSPRAVFHQNTPASGFIRLTDREIAWKTAEHFLSVKIRKGGVIELRDGKRYSHPALTRIAGEKREIVRLRDDHSKVTVLPAAKGEDVIIAERRTRVGTNDAENLSQQMELKKRLQKLVGEIVSPLELNPDGLESPRAITPAPPRQPEPERQISTSAYMMARVERRPILDFADLEF